MRRADYREERKWKIHIAFQVALQCLDEWDRRVERRGLFVEHGGREGTELCYEIEKVAAADDGSAGNGEMVVRLKSETENDVLGKRKREGEESRGSFEVGEDS